MTTQHDRLEKIRCSMEATLDNQSLLLAHIAKLEKALELAIEALEHGQDPKQAKQVLAEVLK